MQANDEVKEYIRSHLEQGFSPQEVVNQLKSAGWQDDHIQPALQWALAAHNKPAPSLHDIPSAVVQPQSQTIATYAQSKRFYSMKKPIMLGIVTAVVLVAMSGLVLFARSAKESPQKTFESTVLQSMQTGTYRQKMTDGSNAEGAIVLEAQSDFRDLKQPKMSGTVTMKYDLDEQTSVKGTLSLKQDFVAIQNTVYLRTTEFAVDNISQDIEKQLLSLRKNPSDTVEDVLMESFGISALNVWGTYDVAKLNDFLAASGGNFNATLASAVAASNTILGEFIIGNLGQKAQDSTQKLLSSGMYTIDYEKVKTEKEGSTEYRVYPLRVNQTKAKAYQTSLITSLGLSDREKDIINLKDSLESKDYTLWINPKTHVPYKAETTDNKAYKVEYSDFGANYTITAPI